MKWFLQILIFAISLLMTFSSYCQEKPSKSEVIRSSLFIELGGNAPLISLNYDCLIPTRIESFKCALTMGSTHHFNKPLDFVIAPQFNTLFGRNLMVEIGVGLTFPISYSQNWVWVPRIGGRYQKMNGGMFYRLAFTPIISPRSNPSIFPMFGISVGYTFNSIGK